MIKKVSGLILLIVMMICSVSLSVTYSKYLLSKSIIGEVNVPEVDYCIRNGITTLSECMLVMENYSESAEAAKLYIASKGIPDFSKTAPVINNVELVEDVRNDNGIVSTYYFYTLGKDYSFDASTGMFTLLNYTTGKITDDYIGYYTCGAGNVVSDTCAKIYEIQEWDEVVSGGHTYNRIISAKVHKYYSLDSFDSEIGLYASDDDYGISYYYRGNVVNNYVSYAGYIWRIVRQNGDGSIRMVYAGKSTSATGAETTIGRSTFNVSYEDPTYVGYMYGMDYVLTVGTTNAYYVEYDGDANYYFGSSYEFDETNKTFKISGDYFYGTWNDNYTNIISNYPYTCFATETSSTCKYIFKTVGWHSTAKIKVRYISYSSKDYESTLANTYSSTVKTYVDTWYENNLLSTKDENGNLYSNYLADSIFCNDRSFYSGYGYSLSPTTMYNSYKRVALNFQPSLVCPQYEDKFTVSSTSGNMNLDYPISLLSLDEISMAGATIDAVNSKFYLYNGVDTMTLSPQDFANHRGSARIFKTVSNGKLHVSYVSSKVYVRPVINLRADIKITSGDGTAEKPYVVSL